MPGSPPVHPHFAQVCSVRVAVPPGRCCQVEQGGCSTWSARDAFLRAMTPAIADLTWQFLPHFPLGFPCHEPDCPSDICASPHLRVDATPRFSFTHHLSFLSQPYCVLRQSPAMPAPRGCPRAVPGRLPWAGMEIGCTWNELKAGRSRYHLLLGTPERNCGRGAEITHWTRTLGELSQTQS